METHSVLFTFLVFLVAAVVVVPVSKRLGMGSVLGYLIAGSIVGPWGLKFVTHVESIMHFAEFGVVMFLFIVGLELKPSRLWVMRKSVFAMGGLQMLVSTLVLSGLAYFFGLNWMGAFLIGFTLSLSSTAFVLQILGEKNQLNTEYGRLSFSILLFQDIVTIPALALVPLLGASSANAMDGVALKILVASATIIGIVLGGRYLLRPVFRIIAASQIKEIFTAAALLLVVGTAYIMTSIGLSMALGTFLAGLLLADSEYRHELEADIDPFKGLLLGLFFMAVGMSVDYGLITQKPLLIVALAIGVMAVKAFVLIGIGKSAGLSGEARRNLAVVLPQVGEFAFVIFAMTSQTGIVERSLLDLLVVVVTLTMAMTPVLYLFNERFFCRSSDLAKPFDQIHDEANPVIIAGFGRFGQIVARILRLQDIGFTALEHDSEQVEVVRRFGSKVYYGDASRLDLLRAAGADRAKIFILAIDDVEASVKTASIVREHFPNLKIYARARNRAHVYQLMDLGIQMIHRETYGSSLALAKETLVELGLPAPTAAEMIEKFRIHDEKVLQEQFKIRHDEKQLINYSRQAAQQLVDVIRADQKADTGVNSSLHTL